MGSTPNLNTLNGARLRAAQARRSSYNGSIKIGSTNYEACVKLSSGTMQLEEGSLMPADSATVSVMKADLAGAPKWGDMVELLSQKWIIRGVGGKEAWAVEWVLTLSKQ